MIYLLYITIGLSFSLDLTLQNLEADAILIQPSCFGIDDASIFIKVKSGTPPYQLQWTSNNGLNTDVDTLTNLTPGSYSVDIKDAAGSSLVINDLKIFYPNKLSISFANEDAKCPGEKNGFIQAVTFGGSPPYKYSIDDGENFQASDKFLGVGVGNYSIIIEDKNGCTLEELTSIDEEEGGFLDLGDDTTAFFNQSFFLDPNIDIDTDNLIYEWSGSDLSYLSCSDCPNPFIGPIDQPLYYTLTIIDNFGCLYEDEIRINLKKFNYINVPTAFTPNGDGQNDLLNIFGSSNSTVKELRIYDKYGAEIYLDKNFLINDRNIGWDGRYLDGKMALPGTYVWALEVIYQDESISNETGVTTLIR